MGIIGTVRVGEMVRMGEKGMRFAERSPGFIDSGFDHSTPWKGYSKRMKCTTKTKWVMRKPPCEASGVVSAIEHSLHGFMQPNRASRPPFR